MKKTLIIRGGIIVCIIIFSSIFLALNAQAGGRGIEIIDHTLLNEEEKKEAAEKNQPQISATRIEREKATTSEKQRLEAIDFLKDKVGGFQKGFLIFIAIMAALMSWVWAQGKNN
ncbi:MAG: hypothetical protein ABIH48_01230 [Candidatus Falkowbacteria bacterium]